MVLCNGEGNQLQGVQATAPDPVIAEQEGQVFLSACICFLTVIDLSAISAHSWCWTSPPAMAFSFVGGGF